MANMKNKKLKKRQTSLKPIPEFKNEDEERKFWATHDVTDYFDMSKAVINPVFPNLKPSTKTISLRLPEYLLERIKELANSRDVPYQSLMKVFLAERVKKEYRST
jgi:predicted DNA binding CopG/RHH family protein